MVAGANDPGAGVLRMVENTVRAREMPELMMQVLAHVARNCHAIESERGEASEAIPDILALHGRAAAAVR